MQRTPVNRNFKEEKRGGGGRPLGAVTPIDETRSGRKAREIIRLYESGMPCVGIIKITGVSRSSISRFLTRLLCSVGDDGHDLFTFVRRGVLLRAYEKERERDHCRLLHEREDYE